MGWFRRAALVATAILWGWLGVAGAVGAAPALWLVRSAHAQIYLFGTLHALDPNAQWRTPAYDAAYERADVVWFETDLSAADPQTLQALLRRYGVDPDHRLSERLDRGDLRALSRRVDLARIDHLRPWAAALMLSIQPAISRGDRIEAGADETMTRVAKRQAKVIRAFETPEQQVRIFADLPPPAELRYLTDTLRGGSWLERLRLRLSERSLERAWLDGDMARLGPRLTRELKADNPALYDALLRRRNLAWADVLTREMDTASGVELVNVGALHMVGPGGLPALMAGRGFSVTRIQ